MFRSLHMKLVLIMVLLIVSLMTVVGAFLVNSVSAFYLTEFYDQMHTVFRADNETLARDLQAEAGEGQSDVDVIQDVLKSYIGALGIDNRHRNYFILDGSTGKCLAAYDEEKGAKLRITPSITAAIRPSRESGP